MRRHARALGFGWNVSVLFWAPPLFLGGVAGAPAASQELEITVILTAGRGGITACEPLVLDVAVRNDGTVTAEFPEMREGDAFPLSFRVTGPDGRASDYLPLELVAREQGPKVRLGPGQVYRHRKSLLYGVWRSGRRPKKADYAFSGLGDYLIQVIFQLVHDGAVRRFESAPLRVTCSEPTGPDLKARQLFRGSRQAEFIEQQTNKQAPPELLRVAREYPQTAYGRYARFYLAGTLLEHRFDWEEARRTFAPELAGLDPSKASLRLQEEVYRRAAEEFAALARSEPAFPLADECLLKQAECYLNSPANRKAEAVKVLEDVVAKYPESPVAVTARKRLEELTRPREPAPAAPAETKPPEAVPAKDAPAPQAP